MTNTPKTVQPTLDLKPSERAPAKSEVRAALAEREPAASPAGAVQFGPTLSVPGSRLKRTNK